MRINGTHIAGSGKEVIDISVGKVELLLIRDMARKLKQELPNNFELMTTKHRLQNFLSRIDKFLNNN